MNLGRVVGTVVSTRKDERLRGFKLLVVKAIDPDGTEKASYVIAVDTVDAGEGELVLLVGGSSARMASGCEDRPVDAAVVGIIDTIDLSTVELAGISAKA